MLAQTTIHLFSDTEVILVHATVTLYEACTFLGHFVQQYLTGSCVPSSFVYTLSMDTANSAHSLINIFVHLYPFCRLVIETHKNIF